MLADSLMTLSFFLTVAAAVALAYDAIWAQGARFQRDSARNRRDSVQRLIEAQISSIESLPEQYTTQEKNEMIEKFKREWEPRLKTSEDELSHWEAHPSRVHNYALLGLFLLTIASGTQCIVYFLQP